MSKIERNVPPQLNASIIKSAESFLSKNDPILSKVIHLHGHCSLCEYTQNPFEMLVYSIMSQQLSAKAANTIILRIIEVIKKIDPQAILDAPQEALRQAGLSNAKIKYIKNLSELVINNVVDMNTLSTLTTEQATSILLKIHGIGRWTVDMFLIFALKHSDVLALGDAGLQRAVKKLYGEHKTLENVSKNWHPYCSVASWYLWRYLDANILLDS